ncbi:L-rhamnose mutarotase [Naumannella huperziae]
MTRSWTVANARTAVSSETARGRACLLLRIRPEAIEDYVAEHQRVWPEMLEALSAAGWRNYSLFIREADGLVVGYFEADDAEAAVAAMAGSQINARWQESMGRYFVPGTGPEFLPIYFHLA